MSKPLLTDEDVDSLYVYLRHDNPSKNADLERLIEQAKLANRLEKRMPPCPPCDMGENTECICDKSMVPMDWMVEALAAKDLAANRPAVEVRACEKCKHWTETEFSKQLHAPKDWCPEGYKPEKYSRTGMCHSLQYSDKVTITVYAGPDGGGVDDIETDGDFFCAHFEPKEVPHD